jgi:hypothetical protein
MEARRRGLCASLPDRLALGQPRHRPNQLGEGLLARFAHRQAKVNRTTTLKVRLVSGGGAAMRIRPTD